MRLILLVLFSEKSDEQNKNMLRTFKARGGETFKNVELQMRKSGPDKKV